MTNSLNVCLVDAARRFVEAPSRPVTELKSLLALGADVNASIQVALCGGHIGAALALMIIAADVHALDEPERFLAFPRTCGDRPGGCA